MTSPAERFHFVELLETEVSANRNRDRITISDRVTVPSKLISPATCSGVVVVVVVVIVVSCFAVVVVVVVKKKN